MTTNESRSASSSFYDLIGGKSGLNALVANYIRALRTRAEASDLLALFEGRSLERYEMRLEEFLSGWLGGPALYQHRHGLPMLREGHRSIRIDAKLKNAWLLCMRDAIDASIEDEALRLKLFGAFSRMAESLVNQA